MSKERFWVLGLATVVIAFLVAACGGAATPSGGHAQRRSRGPSYY